MDPEVGAAGDRDGLTIGDALASAGKASFGVMMLMLSLPALIPTPGFNDMPTRSSGGSSASFDQDA
jgi:hypothetical protein